VKGLTSRFYVPLVAAIALLAVAAVCGPAEQEELSGAPESTETAAAVTDTATLASTSSALDPSPSPAPVLQPSPTTPSLPTPSSVFDMMGIAGTAWIDARPAAGEIRAFINGRECGRGQSLLVGHSRIPQYVLTVRSERNEPGCGTPGAAITVEINGRSTNATIEWQPGFQPPTDLVVGATFAEYRGIVVVGQGGNSPIRIVPYINGAICGEQLDSAAADGMWWFRVVVDSEETTGGCGRDGVQVSFRLEVEHQPDIDLGTEPWRSGSAHDRGVIDASDISTPEPTAATE
jgi:hypothetical protein